MRQSNVLKKVGLTHESTQVKKRLTEGRVPIATTTIQPEAAKEPGTVPIKIQVEVVSPPNEPLQQKQQIQNIRCNSFHWLVKFDDVAFAVPEFTSKFRCGFIR